MAFFCPRDERSRSHSARELKAARGQSVIRDRELRMPFHRNAMLDPSGSLPEDGQKKGGAEKSLEAPTRGDPHQQGEGEIELRFQRKRPKGRVDGCDGGRKQIV